MLWSHIGTSVLKRLIPVVMKSKFCSTSTTSQFETVFSFASIKYIALLNRLKVYHLFGASVLVPSCGAMELANILPEHTFFTASYIGVTGAAVLTLASIPFKNIIGFLYLSDDDKVIKISSVDFWGKRKDKLVNVEDWIPLLDLAPKRTDALYLTPHLADGTNYKLLIRFGTISNPRKFSEVLE